MSKILKNNTGSDVAINDVGQTVPASGQLTIQPTDYPIFSQSSDAIALLSDSTLTYNDGSDDLDLAMGVQHLQGGHSNVNVNNNPTWSDKKQDGKSLFTRTTGKKFTTIVGTETFEFVIPYAQVKFDGIEIMCASDGDTCNLKILDTAAGDYSVALGIPGAPIPNCQLNQFGFDVNIAAGSYKKSSRYDADLFVGMRIVLEYTSTVAKTICVNFLIHELKA